MRYIYYNVKRAFNILSGKNSEEFDTEINQAGSLNLGASIFSDDHHPEGDIMKVMYTTGLILVGDYFDLIRDLIINGGW